MVYRFEPVPGDNRWKRTDLDLWCVLRPDGWAIVDAAGERLGWPIQEAAPSAELPEGKWVSRKGGKSYVYELKFV